MTAGAPRLPRLRYTLCALALVAIAGDVAAYSNLPASIAGRTPRDGNAGCGSCHGSAVDDALSVSIAGPRLVAPGASVVYTLSISRSGATDGTPAGMAMAATGTPSPLQVMPGMPTVAHAPTGEIIHATAAGPLRTTAAGTATYEVAFQMPPDAPAGHPRTLHAVARLQGSSWQFSAPFHLTTPLAPPASLVLGTVTPTSIGLSWSGGGPFYRVVRKPGATAPAGPEDGTAVDVSAGTSTVIGGLSPSTQYAFAVYSRAEENIAFSASAASLAATTSAAFPSPRITTVIGGGVGDGRRAQAAPLYFPSLVVAEPDGSFLIADRDHRRVRRVSKATGLIWTVAGNPAERFNLENVPAIYARIGIPEAIARDAAGNVYLAEGHRVMRVEASSGLLTRVAGSATNAAGFAGDGGPATSALLRSPRGLAVDGAGNVYVADQGNHRVRRISAATGTIDTVAGDGFPGYTGDGIPATDASLDSPWGLALDAAGNLLIADNGNRRIRKVAAGTISTVWSGDAFGITVDGAGRIIVADALAYRIYRVIPGGATETIAGYGFGGFNGDDRLALATLFEGPSGVAVEADGSILVADRGNHRIRRIDAATQIVTTVAGTGSFNDPTSGDAGHPIGARLRGAPESSAVDPLGFLRIGEVEATSSGIRSIDPYDPPIVTTLPNTTFTAPGGALAAMDGIASDAARNTYFSDGARHVVRRHDAVTRAVTVALGTENAPGFAGDGQPAAASLLMSPRGVAVDSAGNLYVATNGRIRKLDAVTGLVSTVAGNASEDPYADNIPATAASIDPVALAIGPDDDLYFHDARNQRVRRIDRASGVLRTVAGNGSTAYSGDGSAATAAGIGAAASITVDLAGNLYLADASHHRLRKVSAADGRIVTISGNGTSIGYGDGGAAIDAAIGHPVGLSTDAEGNLHVGERFDRRLRRIETAARVALASSASSTTAGSAVAFTATVADGTAPLEGVVTFRAGRAKIPGCGSIPIVGAAAVCATSSLPAGTHSIRAIYSGAAATLAARSPAITHVVIVPAPVMGVSASTIAFGGQSMGTTSAPRTVTLSNPLGARAITISEVSSVGPFAVTHGCGVLPPLGSCTLSVTFSPAPLPGTLNGTVPATGTITITSDAAASLVTIGLTGTAERSLVTHYYGAILRRSPDAGGQAFWTAAAARLAALGADPNEAWYAMAQQFYASAEYAAFGRSDVEFLTDLYATFFNRAPDGGGLAFWSSSLEAGVPREVALAQFLFSPEFEDFASAIFGEPAVRAEVDMVMDFYRGLLARIPDDGGFAYWTGRFRAAQCQGADAVVAEAEAISQAFVRSPEYVGRMRTNAQYVGDLYNAFLRRGGEQQGVLFWIREIDTAARTREQVRIEFRNSAEFQARVAAIIAQGCL